MLFIIVISFLIQHRRHVAPNSLHAKIRLRAYLRAGAVTGRRIVRMARMNLPRYVCIPLHLSSLTTPPAARSFQAPAPAAPHDRSTSAPVSPTEPQRGGVGAARGRLSVCPSCLYLPSCCCRGLWLRGHEPPPQDSRLGTGCRRCIASFPPRLVSPRRAERWGGDRSEPRRWAAAVPAWGGSP